jgi:hypothetical protein
MEYVARAASVLTCVKYHKNMVKSDDVVSSLQEVQRRLHTIHGLQLSPSNTATLQTPGPADLPSLKGDPALLALRPKK